VLVLQCCTDSRQLLPGSSTDTFPTPPDCTYGVGNITIDEDVAVIEESFTAANRQTDIGIKQEEIYGDIAFPDKEAELNEVSYVSVCVCLCNSDPRKFFVGLREVANLYLFTFCLD
jgi:hypothetical protein